MNRSDLTNHQFEYSNKNVWVKADNGEKLLCLVGDSSGVKEVIKIKDRFLEAVDGGDLIFNKVGDYGFEYNNYKNKIS